eukprot:Gb_28930 [translate_table: standard]
MKFWLRDDVYAHYELNM